MAACSGELIDRVAIPFEAEPIEPIDNGFNGRIGGAFAICIFDAQQHLPTVMLGKEPIEQSRARTANVEEAGR
jgi:hypothetical protein